MSLNLDQIVNSTITRNTRTVSRRSFGKTAIFAYHELWPERSRLYADPSEMLEDGFGVRHPAYLAALRLTAQTPRPRDFMIARRVGVPDWVIKLIPKDPFLTGTVEPIVDGEIFGFTIGGVRFEWTANDVDTVATIIDALFALLGVLDDAVIATGASAAAAQTYEGAELDGVFGELAFTPPRNLVFTHNGHADWDATVGSIRGLDVNGREIIETLSIPNGLAGGDQVVTLTKIFSRVTRVDIPAQAGAGGTFTLGFGTSFANPDLAITPTDGTTFLQIAADNPGDWFAIEDLTPNLGFEDATAEPTVTLAEDIAGVIAEDPNFYRVAIADAQSRPQIVAAAEFIETQKLVYCALTMDSEAQAVPEDNVADELVDAEYFRTKLFYVRKSGGKFPDAGLWGTLASSAEAEFPDAEYKRIAGIEADDFSHSVITRLVGDPESPASSKRATVYVELLPSGVAVGTPITYGGMTAGGEWLDVIMGLDFANALIQERAINVRLASPRPPFTAEGIDAFVAAVRGALQTCAAAPYNIFVADSIEVEWTAIEDIATRQTRYYDGIQWSATVQGAIRALRIRGSVSA